MNPNPYQAIRHQAIRHQAIRHQAFRTVVAAIIVLASAFGGMPAQAQERVEVPSLDKRAGAAVNQPAFWFEAATAGASRAPAVLLLHGCGGPYRRAGETSTLGSRMRDYARLFNSWGVHVLVTDSLTPRGEKELCTQRLGTRALTQRERRLDAQGALQWLAARERVNPDRIGLIGWSHGGSAVLATTNLLNIGVQRMAVKPALAVAFYPGCSSWSRENAYRPSAPLLLLVGGSDDWTPPQPCRELALHSRATTGTPTVDLHVYEGAFHNFDGRAAVRLRTDVPNGVNPGAGVHVGADPAAREAALRELEHAVRRHLGGER